MINVQKHHYSQSRHNIQYVWREKMFNARMMMKKNWQWYGLHLLFNAKYAPFMLELTNKTTLFRKG